MKIKTISAIFLIIIFEAVNYPAYCADDSQQIDWNKATQLYNKKKNNGQLTPEEQDYLQKAIQARQKGQGPGNKENNNAQAGPGANAGPKTVEGVAPLTELTGAYKGEDGGLYGKGSNDPPVAQKKLAEEATKRIQPLDDKGNPSSSGKIVLLSIGMSNTSMEFQAFMKNEEDDKDKNPNVVLINGAQGGMTADRWTPNAATGTKTWDTVEGKFKEAGVTAKQVQVVWLKQAIAQPATKGEFPGHAKYLKDSLVELVKFAKEHYPNLQVIYLSSRIYAGYATTALNPEPYAFESGFSVRWLILDQINSNKELNCDAAKGEVKAPVLLWGPYLWGNGLTPRKSDALAWNKDDFGKDGTHPNMPGMEKAAKILVDFFKTNPNTGNWYLKK